MQMRLTWPLTGRSEEMGLIEAALSVPESSGMIVCGAAGVGKTRIAREALSAAESKGSDIRWAVATSSAQAIPLGAFASWAGPEATDTLQLVRGVIDALTFASAGTPVLVGVDDVQLLDDLSTFVLQQIVQRRAAKVILTVRDEEPIAAGTQEIWKSGQFHRLDLQPLSREETATLVSAALGGPLHPDAARTLWTLTRGNVLYLRNIVEQEVADGRLAPQHRYWRWTGDPVMPPGLVELIETRIGALPDAVGDVVDVLAVGEPIELAALRRITDPAAVEDAELLGLITVDRLDDHVGVRVAHPLYGELRRNRAASTRLRRLRGLVATELAASERRDEVRTVVRRAALSLDSNLTPDADLFVKAAEGAVWLGDFALADRLADAAIRAGGGAEASIVRAHALALRSRGEEANALLANMLTAEFTAADHARVAFLRANNLLWQLADPLGAKNLIDDASPTTPSGARACIDAFYAEYWAAMGKPQAVYESAKAVVQEQLPSFAGAVTAWAFLVASGDAGRTTEAVAAADAGYAIAGRAFDAAHMRFVIADRHVEALLQAGRIQEARDVADRLRRHATNLAGVAQLYGAAVGGRAALGGGRLDTACSLLKRVVGVLSASGETIGWGYLCQIPRTIALGMRGLADEAAAAFAELEKQRHPSWRCVDYEAALARAWVAAAEGAVGEAISTALSAAETAGANGQFAAEVVCLQAAAQFGDHSGGLRLHELATIVEGPRAGLAARFADALAGGEAPELATVSDELERMGDLVAALDAAAHAAIAYRRQGLRGAALGCSTRAEALAQQCGGANTPALRLATERLPLTDREREIVMLIGDGLSNRAVAERLMLSVRTVESHIYRAMAKTGVTRRDELAKLVPRRAPQPATCRRRC
jgi:DNA-binding CsgD family transcriptional regulator